MSQFTYQSVRFQTALASLNLVHFFFNDTATTEIYTLSLHDALPILRQPCRGGSGLHHDGNTGEQRRRSLFAEPPGGKVEGIDENRGPFCGHQKMLPGERVALRQCD